MRRGRSLLFLPPLAGEDKEGGVHPHAQYLRHDTPTLTLPRKQGRE